MQKKCNYLFVKHKPDKSENNEPSRHAAKVYVLNYIVENTKVTLLEMFQRALQYLHSFQKSFFSIQLKL